MFLDLFIKIQLFHNRESVILDIFCFILRHNILFFLQFIFVDSPIRPTSPSKDGYYSDREDLRRQKSHSNYAVVHDEPDIGLLRRHHEEYVSMTMDYNYYSCHSNDECI